MSAISTSVPAIVNYSQKRALEKRETVAIYVRPNGTQQEYIATGVDSEIPENSTYLGRFRPTDEGLAWEGVRTLEHKQ